MAKRKEEAPSPGSPLWMSTFSDLMNLLLCFFILLFASSTVDADKLEQISVSFARDSIFDAGSSAIGDGKMMSSGVNQLNVLDDYVRSLGKGEEGSSGNLSEKDTSEDEIIDSQSEDGDKIKDESPQQAQTTQSDQGAGEAQGADSEQAQTTQDAQQAGESQGAASSQTTQSEQALEEQVEQTGYAQSAQMNEEISGQLKAQQIEDKVSLTYNAQFVELSLNGGVLFDSGSAELTTEAEALVSRLGDILVKYRKRTIEIEGHTDNIPIVSDEYKDNQFLSAARAISVYEYLLENKNLIPENMKHSGYGDSRPKASNDTAKGRAKNRRVEIKIYNKISSDNE